jgi:hypothetical protein
VYIKTLFRVFRNFYKKELEVIMGKRRKGKPRPNIITSLEVLAQKLFSDQPLDPRITLESLANHLGSLIMPKCLKAIVKLRPSRTEGTEAF